MENEMIVPKVKKKKKFIKAPYLLLLPTLVMITALLFFPMARIFYYSFQNYDISAPFYDSFAGLDNFVKVFTKDVYFIPSYYNIFIGYKVLLIPLVIPFIYHVA